MTEVDTLVLDLELAEAVYAPPHQAIDVLREKTGVILVGPYAIGKSACMETVTTIDPEFKRVQGFTTRKRRLGEDERAYTFLPHDVETLKEIKNQVDAQELVQFMVHPNTRRVYGSALVDYIGHYPMLDVFSSSVDPVRDLPFGELCEFSLTADPAVWFSWKAARDKIAPEDAKHRTAQALDSLTWSLDQGDSMIWIKNVPGQLLDVGQQVIDIARGIEEPDPRNRKNGTALLAAIQRSVS